MCRKILEPLIVKKCGMFVIKSISLGEVLKDSFIKNGPYGCDSVWQNIQLLYLYFCIV